MFSQLRRHLATAQEKQPNISHMDILIDVPGKKLAEKLYIEYISNEDMSRFPLFMAKLDELLVSMGATPADDQETNAEEEDGEQPSEDEE